MNAAVASSTQGNLTFSTKGFDSIELYVNSREIDMRITMQVVGIGMKDRTGEFEFSSHQDWETRRGEFHHEFLPEVVKQIRIFDEECHGLRITVTSPLSRDQIVAVCGVAGVTLESADHHTATMVMTDDMAETGRIRDFVGALRNATHALKKANLLPK